MGISFKANTKTFHRGDQRNCKKWTLRKSWCDLSRTIKGFPRRNECEVPGTSHPRRFTKLSQPEGDERFVSWNAGELSEDDALFFRSSFNDSSATFRVIYAMRLTHTWVTFISHFVLNEKTDLPQRSLVKGSFTNPCTTCTSPPEIDWNVFVLKHLSCAFFRL